MSAGGARSNLNEAHPECREDSSGPRRASRPSWDTGRGFERLDDREQPPIHLDCMPLNRFWGHRLEGVGDAGRRERDRPVRDLERRHAPG